jgi:F0F1-type ATP synthase gamma subunit
MARKNKTQETEEQRQYREMVEKIAGNITALAKAVGSLLNGPLKKKALVILLASSSGLPQTSVEKVLRALEDLQSDWLNK